MKDLGQKEKTYSFNEGLAVLKESIKRTEIFDLAESGNNIPCAELLLKKNPDDFIPSKKEELALVIIKAAKEKLTEQKSSNALEFLKLAVKYTKKKNIIRVLTDRCKLLEARASFKHTEFEKKILEICESISPGKSVLNAIKKKATNLFITPLSPIEHLEHIDMVMQIGTYRWKGDYNASDLFSVLLREFKLGSTKTVEFMSFVASEYLLETPKFIQDIDLIVPVPAESERASLRNYDLAYEVSHKISLKYCIPIYDLILRSIGSDHSKNVSKSELKKQYFINPDVSFDLSGMKVLLIDDIMTTGRTANTCAALIKQLGASKVYFFCLARSESTQKTLKYSYE